MNTREIMELALDMAGMSDIPADSAIYVEGTGIRKILFGIDMGVAEIKIAKDLGFDAVVAHHPQPAVLTFPEIIDIHVRQMMSHGVPEERARAAVARLKHNLEIRYHTGNYDHAPSFARLLGMPYLNIHNPLDEIGRRRMQAAVDQAGTQATVADVVAALETIPEIASAPTRVMVRLGHPLNRAGRVVVSHAAGTNGGSEVAKAYFEHGVDTLVYIHIDPAELAKLVSDCPGKNLIVSGHIASDLVGIMPFVEELRKRGLEVTGVSGIR